MKVIEPNFTRKEKAAWMEKHMPEAIEMMRQGKENGLTFKEPKKLWLKMHEHH